MEKKPEAIPIEVDLNEIDFEAITIAGLRVQSIIKRAFQFMLSKKLDAKLSKFVTKSEMDSISQNVDYAYISHDPGPLDKNWSDFCLSNGSIEPVSFK